MKVELTPSTPVSFPLLSWEIWLCAKEALERPKELEENYAVIDLKYLTKINKKTLRKQGLQLAKNLSKKILYFALRDFVKPIWVSFWK